MISLGVILFFFGTIIGSFLNVVIYRFNSGKTLGGRSMCLSCGKTLHWHELIPLASFLAQRGKCVKCKSSISYQYPIVEAVTGVVFVLIACKYAFLLGTSQTLFISFLTYTLYIWCLLIVISVYDFRHTVIPEKLVWLFSALAFIGLFVFDGTTINLHIPTMLQLAAGPVVAAPFAALWFFSEGKWMGLGDAKLQLGLGWMLGLSMAVSGMMIAFWIGAIVSLLLLVLTRKNYTMKTQIPFGPFLVLGAFLVWLYGFGVVDLVLLFS